MPAAIERDWEPFPQKGKRSLPDDEIVPALAKSNKKQRVGPLHSTLSQTLPMRPHEDILAELRKKYNVLDTSVISSSKIEKKVSSILGHLGRFAFADLAVLPGVIMLHARANDAGKMTSVIEVVKRRINEERQPWYQYNRMYEIEREGRGKYIHHNQTIIEEVVIGGMEEDEDDEDDFETMETEPTETRFEQAIREKPAVETMPYMSIFLSRIPVPELHAKSYITTQSNQAEVARWRKPTS